MRRLFAVAPMLVAGACERAGDITIGGTIFDFERMLSASVAGASLRHAHDGALVAGAHILIAEDNLVRSLSTDVDGRYLVPSAPSRRELHPIAVRFEGYFRTEDGLGIQYSETDVHGYEVGILPRGALMEAAASGLGASADQLVEQGVQLFALYDDAFPDGAPLVESVEVAPSTGRVAFIGWDDAAARFITAPSRPGLPAGGRWLGLLAVTEPDGPVRLTVVDERRGPGRPKLFVQHPMAIAPGRAQLFLLHPVN